MTPSRPPPAIALAPANALRARADRAANRAAVPRVGTPRARFLYEQRRRVTSRLVPTLAAFALAAGAAALGDLPAALRGDALARTTALAEGATAILIAALAVTAYLTRARVAVLHAITLAAGLAHVAGFSVVQAATGGARSPYALAVPFGVAILTVLVPLPWQLALVITVAGALGLGLAAPGAPAAAFVVFAALFAGSVVLARQRRRRDLVAFRRIQRVAASVAKLRRVQDELLVVEKLEAMRVLVGGMAHELNNALTVSVAYTERVRTLASHDPEGVVAASQRVSASLERIRSTVERLRRFALAGEQVLEPADVCAIADFALDSACRTRADVLVERTYEEDLGPVSCHVAALAEALVQIARNAVDAMPKGGTLRAHVRRVGAHVVLSVADEGEGIPEPELARVFDPFFAREELPGRPGLGLSAVYGIVRAMGGEVGIASEVGKGTTVTLRLPVQAAGALS